MSNEAILALSILGIAFLSGLALLISSPPRPGRWHIAHKAHFTNSRGHGTGLFPREQAEAIAASLNESTSGRWAFHYAEEAPEE